MRLSRGMSISLVLGALVTFTGCGSKPPVVLVHGAWMGAWSWSSVSSELQTQGSTVYTVELPAHGQDSGSVATASLGAYADRVGAALDQAGSPAVLVGHSMAGMVISTVAERRPDDISRLIYVAGYLPKSGQSLQELASTDADSQLGPNLMLNANGTVGVKRTALTSVFCADCSTSQSAALDANYRDEPAAPNAEKVALSAANFGRVPKHYVFTLQDKAVSPALQQRMVAATPVTSSTTVVTSHAAMLSQPQQLAAILQSF